MSAIEESLASLKRSLLVHNRQSAAEQVDSKKAYVRWSNEDVELEIDLCNSVSHAYSDKSAYTESGPEEEIHKHLVQLIALNRLCCSAWLNTRPDKRWPAALLSVFRLLLRDVQLQAHFIQIGLLRQFIQAFVTGTTSYLKDADVNATSLIRGFLSVLQKLAAAPDNVDLLVDTNLHMALVNLTGGTKDMTVVQTALLTVSMLSQESEKARFDICQQSNTVDVCLQMTKERDILTQKLAVNLLRVLCIENEAREQIKVYDGLAILIGSLSTKNVRFQWQVAWTLAKLSEDKDAANEMVQNGAVPLILSEISAGTASGNQNLDDHFTMLTGLCSVLAQFCQVDDHAVKIVHENGIYIMGHLLVSQLDHSDWTKITSYKVLQVKTLARKILLFSLERNRVYFKRLFPSEFFIKFIEIGHYNQELKPYEQLTADFCQLLDSEGRETILSSLESVNRRRDPIRHIERYAVLEQLGAGAFGCVYRVRAGSDPSSKQYALKEIFAHRSTVEKEAMEAEKEFGDIVNEVKIIRQKLHHVNIVRYRRIFFEDNKLYITMDLVNGASLKEHINSVREKRQKFPEDRIWNITVQMVLALRYLHKDKSIIHRDLKPNNIMLTDNDHVVITDFGLAKKREESYLKSTAGSILYCCPEMVQGQPYGEKADIWSFGCVLYEMCQLKLPFDSPNQNMLYLANMIVSANYAPIAAGRYSGDLIGVVQSCLKPKPEERADIVDVARLMTVQLMISLNNVLDTQQQLAESQRKNAELNESGCSAQDRVSSAGTGRCPSPAVSASLGRPPRQPKIGHKGSKSAKAEPWSLSTGASSMTKSSRPPSAQQQQQRRRTQSANALPSIGTVKPAMAAAKVRVAWHGAGAGEEPLYLPTIQRMNTWSTVDNKSRSEQMRILSAGSVFSQSGVAVSISAAKLRPISDPIIDLLTVLHSIMFICDLSTAAAGVDNKRRLIEMFKKALFSKESGPLRIKAELRKLSSQSDDPIALDLGCTDYRPLLKDLDLYEANREEPVGQLTYEQLYACIQLVLTERGVSELHNSRPQSRLLSRGNVVSPNVAAVQPLPIINASPLVSRP